VQHPDLDIADRDHLAVGERREVELHPPAVGLVQAVGRAGAPRVVVGMDVGVDDVGVDDVGDAHLGALGLGDEPVLVTGHHIDRHRHALAGAAKKNRTEMLPSLRAV